MTNTGRKWNGADVSVRDKVSSKFGFNYETTNEIISAFNSDQLLKTIMLNIHPQRWNDSPIAWTNKLIGQKAMNLIKSFVVISRKNI